MQQHEISPEVITELIQFLSPNIPRYLRQQALDYIVGLSASNQFNIIFQMKNFLLGRSLCRLACEDNVDENCVISSLINVSSADVKCAGYIASNSELIQQCIGYCRDDNVPRSLNAAKLLSNLSLHFPDKLYHALIKDWKDATADIITRLNGTSLCEVTDYLGYILVNLTSVAKVRCLLCDKFRQILRLVDCSERPKRRLIAIDILRNLCFEKMLYKTRELRAKDKREREDDLEKRKLWLMN
uniref:Protein HGH1 homolog n=1 Tax=Setaria digitata TaxID=48799 RepID=A0A915PXS6_9BILA